MHGRHCPLTRRVSITDGGHLLAGTGQECRRRTRGTGAVAEVGFHFIAKHDERASDESGNAIWVTTSASPFDEIAQFENGRKAATETHWIEGENFEVGGKISEAMDAGSALPGSLLLHVANHASRLSQRAMGSRQQGDDAGAQRGVQLPGRLFAEATLEEVGDRDPSSSVATQQCSPVPVCILWGERQEISEGDAQWCFDNQWFRPPPGDGEQHGAGRIRCPLGTKPKAPEPADHRHVGERLHILHQGASPAHAVIAD